MARKNHKKGKSIKVKTKQLFGRHGIVKIGPQYRTGFKLFKKLIQLVEATLKANTQIHILQEDFENEKEGYKDTKEMMVVMDSVDYCKTIFGRLLIKLYKDEDKDFVNTIEKIISLIKQNNIAEANKLRGKYYIIISGNTRYCDWWLEYNSENPDIYEDDDTWTLALEDFEQSKFNFDLTEDFSKKSYERTIMNFTLELVFRISKENKISSNLVDENKFHAFDYISNLLQEYVYKFREGKETFIENLMLIKGLGIETAGINLVKDLLKGSIYCSLEEAFKEAYVKGKFKGIDETQSKDDKNRKKITGSMKDAASLLAGKIRLRHKSNENYNKNLLKYAGLDLNLNVIDSENLLNYLDLICRIKNLSEKASTQFYLNSVIEIPDFFNEDNVTKAQWAVFEDRALNNAMEAEKIVNLTKKDLKNYEIVLGDAPIKYNDAIMESLKKIQKVIKR